MAADMAAKQAQVKTISSDASTDGLK